MGIRIHPDSDEELCGADCEHHGVHGWMACMRVAGHKGKHIALVRDAAIADGMQHCCWIPLGSTEHRRGCHSLLCSNVLPDASVCSLAKGHEGECDPGNK